MKTLIITLFIWLLFSLSMKAQTEPTAKDSSHNTLRQKDNELIKQPQPDLVQVEANELPAALLKTLEKPKFEGWKNSVIFFNKPTKEYMFTIGDGEKVITYRFNAKGDLIKKEKDN